MNYEHEFGTIELLINSDFETRGVDSFSLAIIKAERQIRKLFTFLIFQNPSYSNKDCISLKNTLFENRNVYFNGFVNGIDLILDKPIHEIYGNEYHETVKSIIEFIPIRNKLFHGQVTNLNLGRKELIEKTKIIQNWCKRLALVMNDEIGYDGFGRNSYHKSSRQINLKNMDDFNTIEKYDVFIKTNMGRNQP